MRIVIPSVNYDDMLAVTLPAWRSLVPHASITVVTSPEDRASQRVAREVGVSLHVTDAWTRDVPLTRHGVNGPIVFNKALALDEAFGFVGDQPPPQGELCASVDVDVYPLGQFPDESVFDQQTLSGFWRYECPTPADLEACRTARRSITSMPRMKTSGGRPVGFCQIFRYRPGLRFGSYPTAAKYDIHIFEQFQRLEMRAEVSLLHLGGKEGGRANWRGRVVPRWEAA